MHENKAASTIVHKQQNIFKIMVIDSSHGNTLNDVEKDLVLNSTGKYFIVNNETAGYDF